MTWEFDLIGMCHLAENKPSNIDGIPSAHLLITPAMAVANQIAWDQYGIARVSCHSCLVNVLVLVLSPSSVPGVRGAFLAEWGPMRF